MRCSNEGKVGDAYLWATSVDHERDASNTYGTMRRTTSPHRQESKPRSSERGCGRRFMSLERNKKANVSLRLLRRVATFMDDSAGRRVLDDRFRQPWSWPISITASRQNSSLRGIANTATNHFGTGDSRELLTPSALRSKNFRPTFFSAPFLKSAVTDTAAERFVACTSAPIIPYPERQSSSNDDPHAQQTCRLQPSIRAERYRSDTAARRVSSRHRRAVDRGIVVPGLSARFDDDFCPGPSCLHG